MVYETRPGLTWTQKVLRQFSNTRSLMNMLHYIFEKCGTALYIIQEYSVLLSELNPSEISHSVIQFLTIAPSSSTPAKFESMVCQGWPFQRWPLLTIYTWIRLPATCSYLVFSCILIKPRYTRTLFFQRWFVQSFIKDHKIHHFGYFFVFNTLERGLLV